MEELARERDEAAQGLEAEVEAAKAKARAALEVGASPPHTSGTLRYSSRT